ncbi:hypothetical protein TSUD_369720 [Trifolium subterraneum]|uniref:Integrase catalytic domain-containing protein n=1 Tax=Trifolium subterraneum TaxID=3900 RepID=A0A2Z6LVZ7_TRISU|nr:hypothetical protein TSUD_369720 [Trifolium subterraneum]
MQIRRDKGLCYFCNERFSHTHRCPNRRLIMLQLTEEDDNELEPDPPEESLTSHTSEDTQHQLSLNAMKGISGMGIIRFTGRIGNIDIQVLVDGESSDTYLQPRIAHFLRVPIEPTPKFQVLVGNGQSLTVEGIVRQLHVQVQGHELTVPAYLLLVAGADLILGSSWLASLGPHIADYAALTLKFYQNGKYITLQGDTSAQPLQAQFHQLSRMHHTNAIAECFTIQMLALEVPQDILSDLPSNMEPELAILLHTYQKVFHTPTGLPPPREKKHEIHLQEGTTPVKLDLRSGYHHILIKPEDRHKTKFRTHHGHYECPSWHLHLEHLEWILQVLEQNELYAKLSKCSFGQREVDYLGHIVSYSGVLMDAGKIKDVLEWPIPKNIKQVRGFLGLTGYYRRFIKAYAQIVGPLTDLLKKDAFVWNNEAETSFNKLKHAITSAPVLRLPDFSKPFTLETDASGTGVGAVLTQQGQPIAFFSKKLSPRRQKQSAYIRELLVITEALAKFRHYLLGHKFIIKTDQKSLKSLMDQSLQTPEQQAWLHKFIGFDFHIEYKPGRDNIPADALSRMNLSRMSTAYHPQTDGQSEIFNKCLEMYLRCFTFQNPKTWYKILAMAEYWYNTSFHHSAGMTPFKALYGRDPPAIIRYVVQPNDVPSMREQLLQRDVIIEQLKSNLLRAQQRMKHYVDKKRKDVEFKVGDKVLVKLQPYRQHSTTLRKNQKLSMRYFGPFNILAKVGTIAYKLDLPSTAKIHPVFHIAQLKPFKGNNDEPYIPLPLTTSEIGPTFQPAKVLDTRMIVQGNSHVPQVLIQWGKNADADVKWEDFTDIKDNYPSFNLKDKIVLKGGGIVMKGNMDNNQINDDSANVNSTNFEGVRKGSRIRVASTRLDGYITNK